MKSLGSHFKREREEKGYSIEDVAEETNIASRYLKAIEEHDFSQFPADVYAKGFIRNYANFLDLDAQALVMEYSLNFEDDSSGDGGTGSSKRILYWLSVGIITLLAFFLVFLRFAWLPAGTSPTVRKSIKSSSQNLSTDTSLKQKSLEVENKPDHLKLRAVASSKTWVYAIFDGLRKREFMFQPGDKMTWKAEDTIRLRMGNAGGLTLYYRGKSLPKLGKMGEVADRIITLSDGKIEIKSPG